MAQEVDCFPVFLIEHRITAFTFFQQRANFAVDLFDRQQGLTVLLYQMQFRFAEIVRLTGADPEPDTLHVQQNPVPVRGHRPAGFVFIGAVGLPEHQIISENAGSRPAHVLLLQDLSNGSNAP